jgi:hypothetical protein
MEIDKRKSYNTIKELPTTSKNYHQVMDLCDSFYELYGDHEMFFDLIDHHTAIYQKLCESPLHIEFPYPFNYN